MLPSELTRRAVARGPDPQCRRSAGPADGAGERPGRAAAAAEHRLRQRHQLRAISPAPNGPPCGGRCWTPPTTAPGWTSPPPARARARWPARWRPLQRATALDGGAASRGPGPARTGPAAPELTNRATSAGCIGSPSPLRWRRESRERAAAEDGLQFDHLHLLLPAGFPARLLPERLAHGRAAGRQRRLLRLGRRPLHLPAGRPDPGELRRRARPGRGAVRAEARRPHRPGGPRSGRAGGLQICGLPGPQPEPRHPRRALARDRAGPAAGDLVLHLPADQLRGRRLLGRVEVEREPDPVRRLHPDVPAPDRRPDRALRQHRRGAARRPAQDQAHRAWASSTSSSASARRCWWPTASRPWPTTPSA